MGDWISRGRRTYGGLGEGDEDGDEMGAEDAEDDVEAAQKGSVDEDISFTPL